MNSFHNRCFLQILQNIAEHIKKANLMRSKLINQKLDKDFNIII